MQAAMYFQKQALQTLDCKYKPRQDDNTMQCHTMEVTQQPFAEIYVNVTFHLLTKWKQVKDDS